MKLQLISDGRKNLKHRLAITDGTSIVYDNNGTTIRKLTTPEALQYWSRKSCPNWHLPDANQEPICTVVYENAVDYISEGVCYYVEINNKPTVMATPAIDKYFYYPANNYYATPPTLVKLINQIAEKS